MYYETRKLIYWLAATIGVGFSTVAYSVDLSAGGAEVGMVAWIPAAFGIVAAAFDAHQHRKTSDSPDDVVVSES